jgi:hypothetical protein
MCFMRILVIAAASLALVSQAAIAGPEVTVSPLYDPDSFQRVAVSIEVKARFRGDAARILEDRMIAILMSKGFDVVDLALVPPEAKSGLAVMRIAVNQAEVRTERQEKTQIGGWLGKQMNKGVGQRFQVLNANVSVTLAAADTGSRLWLANNEAEITINNEDDWDQGLTRVISEIGRELPNLIADERLTDADVVLNKMSCGAVWGDNKRCKIEQGTQVRLIKQQSTDPCIRDVTWGFKEGEIWVREGCKAEFAVLQ